MNTIQNPCSGCGHDAHLGAHCAWTIVDETGSFPCACSDLAHTHLVCGPCDVARAHLLP